MGWFLSNLSSSCFQHSHEHEVHAYSLKATHVSVDCRQCWSVPKISCAGDLETGNACTVETKSSALGERKMLAIVYGSKVEFPFDPYGIVPK